MHLTSISRRRPAQAASLVVVLDTFMQIIGVIRALETLLGVDFSTLLNKDE